MIKLSPLQCKINFYKYYFSNMASDIFEFRVHVRNALQKWLRTNEIKFKNAPAKFTSKEWKNFGF